MLQKQIIKKYNKRYIYYLHVVQLSITQRSLSSVRSLCRIESLIILECPTITIESMIMAIAQ